MSELYVPVSVESIQSDDFPDVALFLKSKDSKHTLYRSNSHTFSAHDAERLHANGIEFLYVKIADIDVVTEFMEKNADRVLKDEHLEMKTKGKIICQTAINYVGDIFEHPEKVSDFPRSKRMIENLLQYLSGDTDCLKSIESVMSHNFHTFVHSLQVTALSILLHSEVYMLAPYEMLDVGIGTLLHDFGNVFIPREILNKTGNLTESDLETYRTHAQAGYDYLKENTSISDIALSIVRYHHERKNGAGYPCGLKGDEIPRSAQVAAVCDMYCTLTIDRSGRKALPPYMALMIMKQEMKGAFSERVVAALGTLVAP